MAMVVLVALGMGVLGGLIRMVRGAEHPEDAR